MPRTYNFHKNPSIGTYRPEQTVQTKLTLLLEEQFDQGLHCLPAHLYLLDALLHRKTTVFHFFFVFLFVEIDSNYEFRCANF